MLKLFPRTFGGIAIGAFVCIGAASALDQSLVNMTVDKNVQWMESVAPLLMIYADKGTLTAADAPAAQADAIDDALKAAQLINQIRNSLDAASIKIAPSADVNPALMQKATNAIKIGAAVKSAIELKKPANATTAEADFWSDVGKAAGQAAVICAMVCDKKAQ